MRSRDLSVDGPFSFTSVLSTIDRDEEGGVAYAADLYWGTYNNERVWVHLDGDTTGVESLVNSTVRMRGEIINGEFHVSLPNINEAIMTSEDIQAAAPVGNKTMAVILVNFTDSPTPVKSKADQEADYFGVFRHGGGVSTAIEQRAEPHRQCD